MKRIIVMVVVSAIAFFLAREAIWEWGICRENCDPGESLQITKVLGGKSSEKGTYAEEGQMGVYEALKGPGRHMDINPFVFKVEHVPDITLKPHQFAVLKNNVGTDVDDGRILVGPTEKGTQIDLLTPGNWRINPYGQVLVANEQGQKIMNMTVIDPGYVGVLTRRYGKDKGVILDRILQSGHYFIHPVAYGCDPFEIGYTKLDIKVEKDKNGNVIEGSGVSFPLSDGTQMHLELTVVWGIFPENAPYIFKTYGTLKEVEENIIIPQVVSICKNAGSDLTTEQFIKGESREAYQKIVTDLLKAMGKSKKIHIRVALIRGFHPDEQIKETIQAKMIAKEEKETIRIEQQRDTFAALLEEAEKMVITAQADFNEETAAIVEGELQNGLKQAAELEAEVDRKVAAIAKEEGDVLAQITIIEGEAQAKVTEAQKKAKAQRYKLHIDACGGADNYNMATFADALPNDLTVNYRYAGEGTLWTDADNLVGLAAKQTLSKKGGK
jgi:regulator of protease activity HflC (stomatin/prohibitin superfamily)